MDELEYKYAGLQGSPLALTLNGFVIGTVGEAEHASMIVTAFRNSRKFEEEVKRLNKKVADLEAELAECKKDALELTRAQACIKMIEANIDTFNNE